VLAAGATVAGALAGEHFGMAVIAIAGLTSATAALTIGRRRAAGAETGAVLGLVALGLLGALSMTRAVAGLDGPLAGLARRGEEVVVAAHLVDDPAGGRAGVRALARLEAGGWRGHVLVEARGEAAMRLRLLAAGETAVLAGRLRPLEGRARTARWRHAAGALVADDLLAARPGSSAFRLANRLRALVLRGSAPLPAGERALVAGFLVGDDRELPPETARQFRLAGLSHLLVVSGANVALALVVARPLLRRFGLLGRLVGGMAVLGLFAAMTRFEPSVLRASAMAGLSLLAAFLGRPSSGTRLLALAVTALVLADPFLVHSLGFQLSCGASAGIVLLAAPMAVRLPGPGFVRQPLAVTAAAQVGVAPVALPAFGSLPLVALPANLLAAPAAAALTVWGLGSGLAGGLLGRAWPAGAGWLQLPTGALARYLSGVAALASRFPLTVTAGQAAMVAVIAGGFALRRGRRSRFSVPAPAPAVPPVTAPGRGRTAPVR